MSEPTFKCKKLKLKIMFFTLKFNTVKVLEYVYYCKNKMINDKSD